MAPLDLPVGRVHGTMLEDALLVSNAADGLGPTMHVRHAAMCKPGGFRGRFVVVHKHPRWRIDHRPCHHACFSPDGSHGLQTFLYCHSSCK